MALDPYSICPGGTGKKIKFCCADLLPELEKLDRMLEGEQFQAALNHIDRLDSKYADRACLLATKAFIERATGQIDRARATVERFLEKHPNNPVALAESAILVAATEGGVAGMPILQRALSASADPLEPRVYEAIRVLGAVLASDGEYLAARAMALLQAAINREDNRAMEVMVRMNTHPSIPLLLKSERRLQESLADVPWKGAFDEAMAKIRRARWAEGAEALAALAEQHPTAVPIWRNLGVVRAWLADHAGAIAALEKLATLDIPLEDAVESLALARLLADDPLGDMIDSVDLEYPIADADQVRTALLSSPRILPSPVDPSTLAEEGEPPPLAALLIFDRPNPDAGQPLEPSMIPQLVGQAALFGRQTDREARLEVLDVSRQDLDGVKALLADAGGGQLAGPAREEVVGKSSATQELLSRNWRLPDGTTREDLQRLTDQYLEKAILVDWPKQPLGLLDGKLPEEAAGQEAYRVRLPAAILVLDQWLDQRNSSFDLNRLRQHLGLPALEPIDPTAVDLKELPLVRLARLVVDRLTDEGLLGVYHRGMAFNARRAMQKFAREVAERPSLSGKEEQLHAFMILARMTEDMDKALQYVEQGRRAAEAAGQSSASWDLLELSFRFQRGEGAEAMRLIQHLQRQHIREPGVAQALTDLLIEVGLLRPDGSFAGAPSAPPQAVGPGIVVPDVPGAEPGKIWTPDSQASQGEKSKLWVPGME